MLLYELFTKPLPLLPLLEARRNPKQNLKAEGHEAAVNFLKNKGREMRNYGVSMTTIPKLGINPGSRYNTPVGIYFYPAEYYVRNKEVGKKLEFQDDAPYIQVFELKGNYEDIDAMSSSVYTEYVRKLFNNVGKVATLLNLSEKEAMDLLSKCTVNARSEAKNDTYGGHLWYILYAVSSNAGKEKRNAAPPRSSVVWNSLLRLLGIDGLIDSGEGIIHENEPNQGVALDPRSVTHVNTFRNGKTADDPLIEVYNDLANTHVGSYYVENLISSIRDDSLQYNAKYKKQCDTIIGKALELLRAKPALYTRLSKSDIDIVLRLTNNPAVKQEMIVDLYEQKLPRVYTWLRDMVTAWNEMKSEPGWDEKSDARKLAIKKIIVEQYKIDQAKTIIKDLTPYNSNPKAAKVINDIEEVLVQLQ